MQEISDGANRAAGVALISAMTRRTLLAGLLGMALLGSPWSCVSPTLPLPPPDEPSHIAETGTDGLWDVRGTCTVGAIVLIKNDRTGQIVGYEDEQLHGRYQLELPAERCDPAQVFELIDDALTEGTTFWVREVQGGVAQTDECGSAPP